MAIKLQLSKSKPIHKEKLYFINLGGYDKNKFEELHESKFLIGPNRIDIKKRAKEKSFIRI